VELRHTNHFHMLVTPWRKRTMFNPRWAPRRRTYGGAVSNTAKFTRLNRHQVGGPSRTGPLRVQVKKLQSFVKKFAPETKSSDTAINQLNITSAGVIQHLSTVAQGTQSDDRIGDSIIVTGLLVRGAFQTISTGSFYRIAIVVDKQQHTGGDPTVTQIFEDPNPLLALPESEALERFKYLHVSEIFEGTAMSLGGQRMTYEFSWKGTLKCNYDGANGGDIQKNGIYLVVLTDSTANTVDFVGGYRIEFTDP